VAGDIISRMVMCNPILRHSTPWHLNTSYDFNLARKLHRSYIRNHIHATFRNARLIRQTSFQWFRKLTWHLNMRFDFDLGRFLFCGNARVSCSTVHCNRTKGPDADG